MLSVLLCCVDEDESRVDLLALALEKAGIAVSVFVAAANQKKPATAGKLQRLMSTSDVVVVCWSKQSLGTSWMKRSARHARRMRQYLALQLDRVSLGWWVRSRFNGTVLGWPARSADKGVEELLETIQMVIQAKTERVHLSLPGGNRAFVVIFGLIVLAATFYYGSRSSRETASDAPPAPSETAALTQRGNSISDAQASAAETKDAAETGSEMQNGEPGSEADILPGEMKSQKLMATELGTLSARQLRAVILGERRKLSPAERNARSALEVDPAEPSALLTLGLIELFGLQNRDRGRALIERFLETDIETGSEPSTGNMQTLQQDDRGFLRRSLQAFDQGASEKQTSFIPQRLPGGTLANPRLTQLCRALGEHDKPLARRLVRQLDAAGRLQILAQPCLLQRLNQSMNQDVKQAIVIPEEAPDNA